MAEKILLKHQRNDVFKAINDALLDPNDFEWVVELSCFTHNLKVHKLIHNKTGYYFKFDLRNDMPAIQYFPNYDGIAYAGIRPDWQNQLVDIIIWVGILKGELQSSDLWETSINASKIFEPTADSDLTNESFAIDEQNYITSRLKEIEKYLIEKHSLSSENIAFIKEKIIYLEECSKRIGKKDWLNIVIGTSFKIAVGIGLSSAIAKDFFKLVGTSFGHFLSGPLLLP